MDLPNQTIGLRVVAILVAVIAVGFSSSDCFAQQRTWTDASGTFTLEAELIDVTDTDNGLQAELLMAGGKRMAILVSKLSEADAKIAGDYFSANLKKGAKPETKKIPQNSPPKKKAAKPEKRQLKEAQAEDRILSRPLSSPIGSAGRLGNRNTADIQFDPQTAIRLDREIPRDERGRPTENPVYSVEVTEQQLNFLPPKFRAIVDKLRDENVAIDVKRRAIGELKSSWPQGRQPGLLNVLINTLSHKDKYLRLAALDLLANNDSDQSLIYIFARIDDISFDIRWRTFEALTQLRDPRIIPELCERLEGSDRTKVASVLQVFGATAAPLIHEWVKEDQSEEVLLNVCQLLGKIGDDKSLEVLKRMESHESLLVRAQAENSVKEITQRLSQRASKSPNRR